MNETELAQLLLTHEDHNVRRLANAYLILSGAFKEATDREISRLIRVEAFENECG